MRTPESTPVIDLGLGDKRPRDTRVVVAMSGGVDSSTAAALVKEAGYDVVGMTMQLYDQGEVLPGQKTCCAGKDIYDARRVADQLGFPHYVLNYENRFKEQVMDDFADTYLRGETPIPCVRCNQTVKFKDMLGQARDLGADALVTGHYVRRVLGGGGPELHRAADPSKDQSYFLFTTTGAQLDFLRFPLGGMDKTETRRHAQRLGLAVADKPESMDICFVPDGNYARIVERLRPEANEPGEIVDQSGNVLGHHDGIIHYTVGQRRGIGIGGTEEPLYVIRLEPEGRRVVVGPARRPGARQPERERGQLVGRRPAAGQGAPRAGQDPLDGQARHGDVVRHGRGHGGGQVRRTAKRRRPRSGLCVLPGRPGAGRRLDRARRVKGTRRDFAADVSTLVGR